VTPDPTVRVDRCAMPIRGTSCPREHPADQPSAATGTRSTASPADGVTTLIGDGTRKKALEAWGIRSVAEYAAEHLDRLVEMQPMGKEAIVSALKQSPYTDRDKAANRGTEVHALAEELIHGRPVEVPPELAGHVDSYVRFLDDWQPEPIKVEKVVATGSGTTAARSTPSTGCATAGGHRRHQDQSGRASTRRRRCSWPRTASPRCTWTTTAPRSRWPTWASSEAARGCGSAATATTCCPSPCRRVGVQGVPAHRLRGAVDEGEQVDRRRPGVAARATAADRRGAA
jgi:hypothetical protein